MQKIYFNTRTLYLLSENEIPPIELKPAPGTIIFENGLNKVDQALDVLKAERANTACLIDSDTDLLLDALKSKLTLVEAAGGLVQTDKGELLLIFRRGKWDLPKGKRDDGESLEVCALREIEEETGLQQGRLGEKILTTYHTYEENGQSILKESHWFFVSVPEKQELQPQTEEDIEQCIWVQPEQLPQYLTNTHGSVKDVLLAALKKR